MNSRELILRTLRESLREVREVPRPTLDATWIEYPDLYEQFATVAAELPAQIVQVEPGQDVTPVVCALDCYRRSKSILSFVEGIDGKVAGLTSPHDAQVLDLTIARGQLGVAESGAIWVSGAGLEPRSALFLAQHLVLLLDRRSIVPHLHAAYERIDVTQSSFGAFIAGPSKTADIEQALVIGAHGPRSLTIVVSELSATLPSTLHARPTL